MAEIIELTESQKQVVNDLESAMKNLFKVFVQVDIAGLSISDALEMIGMEVPIFARPALNQISGRLKTMREEAESAAANGRLE